MIGWDNKRLEYIKDKILQMYSLSSFDIKWLVEKVEKLFRLEELIQGLRRENLRLSSKAENLLDRNSVLHSDITANRNLYEKSERENKRYREALEFYAEVDNYYDKLRVVYSELERKDVYVNDGSDMDDDNKGDKARQALEVETHD